MNEITVKRKRKPSPYLLDVRKEDLVEVQIKIPSAIFFQLKTCLRHEGIIRISDFMCEVIRLYLEKDEKFTNCMESIRDTISVHKKERRKNILKEQNEMGKLMKELGLWEGKEKENIFDVIEQDEKKK